MKINKKSSGSLFKKIFCLRGLEVGTNGVLGSLRNWLLAHHEDDVASFVCRCQACQHNNNRIYTPTIELHSCLHLGHPIDGPLI